MPRRRLIDPIFWNDRKVGKLSRDERSLITGCLGHADDEGRLQGDPPYLKATIFKYDDDLDTSTVQKLRDSCLEKMQSWPYNHPYRMTLYINSEEDYIFFPNWESTNRPSHPAKSQLPTPPPEALPTSSGNTPEELATPSRLGQVSQVKESLSQVSAVQDDFTNLNESDLTERLMKTMTKNISAGRGRVLASLVADQLRDEQELSVKVNWGFEVLKKCWQDCVGGQMPQVIFEGTHKALKLYPLELVAKAFAKGVRYKGGKHKSWKYFQTIIDEQLERIRAP